MAKLEIGKKYKIAATCGVDKGKVGRLIPFPGEATLKKHDTGWYRRDGRLAREDAFLMMSNGRILATIKPCLRPAR